MIVGVKEKPDTIHLAIHSTQPRCAETNLKAAQALGLTVLA
jgi:hypothetical protein